MAVIVFICVNVDCKQSSSAVDGSERAKAKLCMRCFSRKLEVAC